MKTGTNFSHPAVFYFRIEYVHMHTHIGGNKADAASPQWTH